MVACAICGKDNPAGVEYCEDCGAALTTSATPLAGSGDAPVEVGEDAPAPESVAPFTAQDAATTVPPETSAAAAEGGGTPAPMGEEGTTPPPVPESTTTPPPTQIANPRLAPKRYGAVGAEEIPLQGDRLVVGRFDPETGPVDIDLSGTPEAVQLSRHHAELYREADGGWYVKDLGSTNGVFLKRPGSSTFGPRLITPTAMQPGDEVAFGNARFIFKAD